MSDQHRVHARAWRVYLDTLAAWTGGESLNGVAEAESEAGALTMLKAARVFAFDEQTVEAIERLVHSHLSTVLPEAWDSDTQRVKRRQDYEEVRSLVARLTGAVKALGVPRLPFPAVFLWLPVAHGAPDMREGAEHTQARTFAIELLGPRWASEVRVHDVRTVGLLASDERVPSAPNRLYLLVEIDATPLVGERIGSRYRATAAIPCGWDGKPERPWTLGPFTLHAALAAIEQCNTTNVDVGVGAIKLSADARRVRRLGLAAHIPRSYHAVTLQPSLVWGGEQPTAPAEEPPPGSHLTHRHDVRGHWRVLVRTGAEDGPCPPASRAALERRGYRVFDRGDEVPEEDAQAMTSRGVYLHPARWFAVLRVWVRDHVRGPEDGPFIPTVRKARPEL